MHLREGTYFYIIVVEQFTVNIYSTANTGQRGNVIKDAYSCNHNDLDIDRPLKASLSNGVESS